jgi:hypothetical protein
MSGRPTKLTEALKTRARAYIDGGFKDHGHAIPSHIGMAKVLGVSKSTLYLWGENKDSDFSDILADCMDAQQFTLLNGGLKSEFNSNICKLVLGKHGFSDKQETEHKGGVSITATPLDEDI